MSVNAGEMSIVSINMSVICMRILSPEWELQIPSYCPNFHKESIGCYKPHSQLSCTAFSGTVAGCVNHCIASSKNLALAYGSTSGSTTSIYRCGCMMSVELLESVKRPDSDCYLRCNNDPCGGKIDAPYGSSSDTCIINSYEEYRLYSTYNAYVCMHFNFLPIHALGLFQKPQMHGAWEGSIWSTIYGAPRRIPQV